MSWGAEYVGSILVVIGGLLLLWKRKRKFDRTNKFGVEEFSSFGRKLGARLSDGFLGFFSLVFFTVGLLILVNRYEDSWGWIVMLPVYGVMLYLVIGS